MTEKISVSTTQEIDQENLVTYTVTTVSFPDGKTLKLSSWCDHDCEHSHDIIANGFEVFGERGNS